MSVLILLPVALLAVQANPPLPRFTDVQVCATPVKTSGTSTRNPATRWITDLGVALTTPPDELRGRLISVTDARIEQVDDSGFWIGGNGGGCRLHVTPAEGRLIHVSVGELVDLQGEFRFPVKPEQNRESPGPSVYAYIVRQAPAGD